VRPQRSQDQDPEDSEEQGAKSKHRNNNCYLGWINDLPGVFVIHRNAVAVMRDGENDRK